MNVQGTVPGCAHDFVLDEDHRFETGKPALVCGNTAAMLGEGGMSWLSKHFQVKVEQCLHLSILDGRCACLFTLLSQLICSW